MSIFLKFSFLNAVSFLINLNGVCVFKFYFGPKFEPMNHVIINEIYLKSSNTLLDLFFSLSK